MSLENELIDIVENKIINEAEQAFEKRKEKVYNAGLEDRNFSKVELQNMMNEVSIIQRSKYYCKKCNKYFKDNYNFVHHFLKVRKKPCNNIIDENFYIIKHIQILSKSYADLKLLALSNIDKSETLLRSKLKSVYKKASYIKEFLEKNPHIFSENDLEDIYYKLQVIIENCYTGDYNNKTLHEIRE